MHLEMIHQTYYQQRSQFLVWFLTITWQALSESSLWGNSGVRCTNNVVDVKKLLPAVNAIRSLKTTFRLHGLNSTMP